MNDAPRPPNLPTAPSPEALLRYAVLAQVEALVLGGCSAGAALCVRSPGESTLHPHGRRVRVSVRTLQRWRAAYAAGGLEALEPRSRRRTLTSVVLSEAMVTFLGTEKERDPRASVPELLRRAKVRGIIPTDLAVDRTTVWRACRRMGLPTRPRPSKHEGDMRRWMYVQRMQCVLCDGKHFRAGAARLRRVALFFLDSATRYGMDVVVGASESTALFLGGLHDLVTKHGLVDLLYLDHGPGFISGDTHAVVQGGLGAWLIHGKAKYPQGRGAVERFNRTAHDQVLRSLDGAPPTSILTRAPSRCASATSSTATTTPPTRPWEATPPGNAGRRDVPFASPKTPPTSTAASWFASPGKCRPITSLRPTAGSGKRPVAWPAPGSR